MELIDPLPFRLRSGRLLRARGRTPGKCGTKTDGLSAPKFAKLNIQSTNSFFPAVAHDGCYRGFIEESKDEGATWTPTQPTKDESDSLLWELCVDNFVPADEARLIYLAVHEFGQPSWDADQNSRDSGGI